MSEIRTGRIRQPAERYAVSQLGDEVAMLAARVEAHLNVMGFNP